MAQDEAQTQWLGILGLEQPGLSLPHQHPSPTLQRLPPYPSPDQQSLRFQVLGSSLCSLGSPSVDCVEGLPGVRRSHGLGAEPCWTRWILGPGMWEELILAQIKKFKPRNQASS